MMKEIHRDNDCVIMADDESISIHLKHGEEWVEKAFSQEYLKALMGVIA